MNNKCKEVEECYIGDCDAFEYFKNIRHGCKIHTISSNNPNSYEISGGTGFYDFDSEITNEYENLFNAFHKTIHDCNVDGVGGFVMPIALSKKDGILYRPSYIKGYAKIDMNPDGSMVNLLDMSPGMGAYSLSFYGSNTNLVGVYIPQASMGIFYSNLRLNEEDYKENSLPKLALPNITRIHPHDFYIQLKAKGLSPPSWSDFDFTNVEYIYKRALGYKLRNKLQVAYDYLNEAICIIEMERRNKAEYAYLYKEREIVDELLKLT